MWMTRLALNRPVTIMDGGTMLITALAAVGLLLAIRLHESPVRL